MKGTLFLFAFILFSATVFAQKFSPEQQAVKVTIDRLFEGMRKGDSVMVRSVFYENAKMQTVFTDKTGNPKLTAAENIEGFVKAVGKPHTEMWDERLLTYDIKIDGNMGIAWTPYEFYAGTKFSHAGVDAFTLFKTENGWKIIYIADTRRGK